MTKINISGITIECIKGNIASQPGITAVVNAANAQLRREGGVAGALHQAAGSDLEKECKHLAPITPGQAVVTKGYNLPNKYVIHCLGPIYGMDKPEKKILKTCYQNILHQAEKYTMSSVALPALSTGAFGYPLQEATEIALTTIKENIPTLQSVKHIRFVLYSTTDLQVYEKTMSKLFPTSTGPTK